MAEYECAELAAKQCGLLTAAEAVERELKRTRIRYRVAVRRWQRVLPSVFRITGTPESWEGRVVAAVLWAEKESAQIQNAQVCVSHGTAARLHGFPGFEHWESVELTMKRHLRHRNLVVHQTKKKVLRPWEFQRHPGLDVEVTTAERTLVDLANRLRPYQLERCVDHCLRTKRVSVASLQRAVRAARGRRGVRKLRRVVLSRSGANGPTESDLEALALEVLDRHGLPRPTRQLPVALPGRHARVDLIFERHRLVVECDGYAWHSDVVSFERDRRRQNELIARGYRVLRWTWAALKQRPLELARQLGALLQERA